MQQAPRLLSVHPLQRHRAQPADLRVQLVLAWMQNRPVHVSCAEKSQGYPGAALRAPVHAHHQGHRARFSDPRRAAKIDSEEPGQTGSAPRARGGFVRARGCTCVLRPAGIDLLL